ncbi:hypothetical protein FRC14_001303 [Serendipita sp. 396]|nr:hypothetical protein FRC14_001303 [Serendipita sp. 396]KAG8774339.1 hypothetical protein FRC15_001361 [Serendipita sp. 397]KAG8789414.1 hypothetical protein FRC16_001226 [Serendipita sp. 398]KAG8815495.1 hypothetical protein FRC19_001008 [Serendipita sp. 401]KAG8815611.1 hypothetical protein FRC18_001422 [Serendipita sp. 400]KAG8853338.1 hypothetical protein FRC20_001263 [Serendipita sp. 405]KAG9048484.1 hypothetical protein FS842_000395 [Serendipita sp. 407]
MPPVTRQSIRTRQSTPFLFSSILGGPITESPISITSSPIAAPPTAVLPNAQRRFTDGSPIPKLIASIPRPFAPHERVEISTPQSTVESYFTDSGIDDGMTVDRAPMSNANFLMMVISVVVAVVVLVIKVCLFANQ